MIHIYKEFYIGAYIGVIMAEWYVASTMSNIMDSIIIF